MDLTLSHFSAPASVIFPSFLHSFLPSFPPSFFPSLPATQSQSDRRATSSRHNSRYFDTSCQVISWLRHSEARCSCCSGSEKLPVLPNETANRFLINLASRADWRTCPACIYTFKRWAVRRRRTDQPVRHDPDWLTWTELKTRPQEIKIVAKRRASSIHQSCFRAAHWFSETFSCNYHSCLLFSIW